MESLYFRHVNSIKNCAQWTHGFFSQRFLNVKQKEETKVHHSKTTQIVTIIFVVTASIPALAQTNQHTLEADSLPDIPTESFEQESKSRLSPSPKIENFLREIENIETEEGPWGSGLSEQLGGLGTSYQSRGQHNEAIDSFERAIHISRINNGLYNLGQVPMVESMIESLLARNRRKDAHGMFDYLYWLHKRSYGENDLKMLPVIDKLGNWFLNDYSHNPSQRHFNELLQARSMFDDADDIANANYDKYDLRLISPLRGIAVSSWFFANFNSYSFTSSIEKQRREKNFGPEINKQGFDSMLAAGTVPRSSVYYPNTGDLPNQLLRYIHTSYVDGKRAFERIIEIYANNPEAPPGAASIAKVELADWHLLHNSKRKAMSLYKEAYSAFINDEATQTLAGKVFRQPVALPDLALVDSLIEQNDNDFELIEIEENKKEVSYVLVSFNINRYGEVKKVSIIESQPHKAAGLRSRVKNTLSATQFRPRFIDGNPVATEGLIHKYVKTDN